MFNSLTIIYLKKGLQHAATLFILISSGEARGQTNPQCDKGLVMIDMTDIVFGWKSNSGKYFLRKRYWIGVGLQFVDFEVSSDVYNLWSDVN